MIFYSFDCGFSFICNPYLLFIPLLITDRV
nr:MAG TPA: hypothetical protein [Crassvirales sp.]